MKSRRDSTAADSNKLAYSLPGIVGSYAQREGLLPAEETILNLLKDSLFEMRMLDIGVGGGRTTLHFAGLVREYTGIDYAGAMIEACRERFSGYPQPISLHVCDARSMTMFLDNTFDFLLFSFNGIDYVSHTDRFKILDEICRVGKPGAWFFFSSHNLKNYFPMFDFRSQISLKPRTTIKKLAKWVRLNFVYNNYATIRKLKHAQYAIINDGVDQGRLQTYYIRPAEQVRQLEGRFSNIQVFASNGHEVGDETDLNHLDDNWLHYLCRIR